MIIEKIIKFVEGELSIMEIEELEQQFLKNPQLLDILGGLNRIKKDLPPNKNLHEYLKYKQGQIQSNICTKYLDDNNLPSDIDDIKNEVQRIKDIHCHDCSHEENTQDLRELLTAIE